MNDAEDVRAETERRRILRDLRWIAGFILAVVILATVDYKHPTIRGSSGKTYSLLEFGERGGQRGELVFRFQVADSSAKIVRAAMLDVLPLAAEQAAVRQDSLAVVVATYQVYHIGWFYHRNINFVRRVRIHSIRS